MFETNLLGQEVFFARVPSDREEMLDTPAHVMATYIGGEDNTLRLVVKAEKGEALWDFPASDFHMNQQNAKRSPAVPVPAIADRMGKVNAVPAPKRRPSESSEEF